MLFETNIRNFNFQKFDQTILVPSLCRRIQKLQIRLHTISSLFSSSTPPPFLLVGEREKCVRINRNVMRHTICHRHICSYLDTPVFNCIT